MVEADARPTDFMNTRLLNMDILNLRETFDYYSGVLIKFSDFQNVTGSEALIPEVFYPGFFYFIGDAGHMMYFCKLASITRLNGLDN